MSELEVARSAALGQLNVARRALAEADNLPDVMSIIDRAEVVRVAARKAQLSLDAQNDWAAFKLGAERKAGELLAQIDRRQRTHAGRAMLHDETLPPTLDDLGIERTRAHRWQRLAAIPEEELEKYTATTRAQHGEITTAGALAYGSQLHVAERRSQHAAQQREGLDPIPTVQLSAAVPWLAGQEPCDLLLTDPPYSTDVEDIGEFAAAWLPAALAKVKPTGRAYVCIGAYPDELRAYLAVQPPSGLMLAQILVWTYRNTMGPSPVLDYKQNWQAVLYYRRPDATRLDCPDLLEQLSVQDVNAADGQHGRWHTWQKPARLAERFIRHATAPGDRILDPFAGTGSFLIAAGRLGRHAAGCDINPAMLAIAQERGCRLAG